MTAPRDGLSEERLREIEGRRHCYDSECRWPECVHGEMARELLALRAKVADCEQDHPPEPEYLEWQELGRSVHALAGQLVEAKDQLARTEAERDAAREALRDVAREVDDIAAWGALPTSDRFQKPWARIITSILSALGEQP